MGDGRGLRGFGEIFLWGEELEPEGLPTPPPYVFVVDFVTGLIPFSPFQGLPVILYDFRFS
jgi:hypothetical protein